MLQWNVMNNIRGYWILLISDIAPGTSLSYAHHMHHFPKWPPSVVVLTDFWLFVSFVGVNLTQISICIMYLISLVTVAIDQAKNHEGGGEVRPHTSAQKSKATFWHLAASYATILADASLLPSSCGAAIICRSPLLLSLTLAAAIPWLFVGLAPQLYALCQCSVWNGLERVIWWDGKTRVSNHDCDVVKWPSSGMLSSLNIVLSLDGFGKTWVQNSPSSLELHPSSSILNEPPSPFLAVIIVNTSRCEN